MTNERRLFNKYIKRYSPKLAWISHGLETHSMNDRYDCLTCIDTELWFLKKIKEAGGQSKILEKMNKELEEERNQTKV